MTSSTSLSFELQSLPPTQAHCIKIFILRKSSLLTILDNQADKRSKKIP